MEPEKAHVWVVERKTKRGKIWRFFDAFPSEREAKMWAREMDFCRVRKYAPVPRPKDWRPVHDRLPNR